MLGDIVQMVTGQRIDAFLQARLAGPLGMVDTAFDVPAANHARVVTVHQRTNGSWWRCQSRLAGGGRARRRRSVQHGHRLRALHPADPESRPGRRPPAAVRRDGGRDGAQPDGRRARAAAAHRGPPRSRPFPIGAGQDTWGFGFQIAAPARQPRRRKPGSLTWAGINNTHFFIDPASGVGAIVLMQVLPFYDEAAMRVLDGFEERLYRHLR